MRIIYRLGNQEKDHSNFNSGIPRICVHLANKISASSKKTRNHQLTGIFFEIEALPDD
jgi:hypothetical protein